MTNDYKIILNPIITNKMLLHVSTFKMSSSGCTLCLAKIIYRIRPENLYVSLTRHNEIPEEDILNVETCSSALFVITVFDTIVQFVVKL